MNRNDEGPLFPRRFAEINADDVRRSGEPDHPPDVLLIDTHNQARLLFTERLSGRFDLNEKVGCRFPGIHQFHEKIERLALLAEGMHPEIRLVVVAAERRQT